MAGKTIKCIVQFSRVIRANEMCTIKSTLDDVKERTLTGREPFCTVGLNVIIPKISENLLIILHFYN